MEILSPVTDLLKEKHRHADIAEVSIRESCEGALSPSTLVFHCISSLQRLVYPWLPRYPWVEL